MNVIGHQVIGPDFHSRTFRVLCKQIEKDPTIFIISKDVLAAITALSHVMSKTGKHNPSISTHVRNFQNGVAGMLSRNCADPQKGSTSSVPWKAKGVKIVRPCR